MPEDRVLVCNVGLKEVVRFRGLLPTSNSSHIYLLGQCPSSISCGIYIKSIVIWSYAALV